MKKLIICIALSATMLHAQTAPQNCQYEGIWEGYEGEWGHVSRQLIALAEAIPADNYSWLPTVHRTSKDPSQLALEHSSPPSTGLMRNAETDWRAVG
jgi:hypothetical protein